MTSHRMNTNAVPAVFWFFIEFCLDPVLLDRARAEMDVSYEAAAEPHQQHLDIVKLCNSPLLQSVYAETLRLRVALLVTRTPENKDFHLGCWKFSKDRPIIFSSQTAGMNPEIWNAGTHEDPHPLEEFWADRFLVYPDDSGSGPSKNLLPPEKAAKPNRTENQRAKPYFSMQRAGAGWIPYGGGQRMCPGRHFAKQEIIGTAATLCTLYDIELLTPRDWKPKPDMRYFPFGGLPPIGKVPFRIRKRKL